MGDHFFIGVGGNGMSGLAQILVFSGAEVAGSDRKYDRDRETAFFRKLAALGIRLFPQDGSGVTPDLDRVFASGAIEEDNPDLRRARELGLRIISRSELLAELFNPRFGIAVGGMNGKTTTTGMVGHILLEAGMDPTIINGGILLNLVSPDRIGNARLGRSPYICIEADESDGSIVLYRPRIGVLTSMGRDHKEVDEMREFFRRFGENTRNTLIVNADCDLLKTVPLPRERTLTYGFSPEADLAIRDVGLTPEGSSFSVRGSRFSLRVPGEHNVSNAAGAAGAAEAVGIPLERSAKALRSFPGIKRRLELVGKARGVRVVDDFSHNPPKIAAALNAMRIRGGRILAVFQPHGFIPTRFMWEGYIETFGENLEAGDILFLPDIYDAGGTTDRSVHSKGLVREIGSRGILCEYAPERGALIRAIAAEARQGDTVLVMGARDNTLTDLALAILRRIGGSAS